MKLADGTEAEVGMVVYDSSTRNVNQYAIERFSGLGYVWLSGNRMSFSDNLHATRPSAVGHRLGWLHKQRADLVDRLASIDSQINKLKPEDL